MKFIDFFAGVGGFTRGFELAGHECIGHCEFDKYAAVNVSNVPRADCWTFGAPCQDFSLAGRRAGLDGERSSLGGKLQSHAHSNR